MPIKITGEIQPITKSKVVTEAKYIKGGYLVVDKYSELPTTDAVVTGTLAYVVNDEGANPKGSYRCTRFNDVFTWTLEKVTVDSYTKGEIDGMIDSTESRLDDLGILLEGYKNRLDYLDLKLPTVDALQSGFNKLETTVNTLNSSVFSFGGILSDLDILNKSESEVYNYAAARNIFLVSETFETNDLFIEGAGVAVPANEYVAAMFFINEHGKKVGRWNLLGVFNDIDLSIFDSKFSELSDKVNMLNSEQIDIITLNQIQDMSYSSNTGITYLDVKVNDYSSTYIREIIIEFDLGFDPGYAQGLPILDMHINDKVPEIEYGGSSIYPYFGRIIARYDYSDTKAFPDFIASSYTLKVMLLTPIAQVFSAMNAKEKKLERAIKSNEQYIYNHGQSIINLDTSVRGIATNIGNADDGPDVDSIYGRLKKLGFKEPCRIYANLYDGSADLGRYEVGKVGQLGNIVYGYFKNGSTINEEATRISNISPRSTGLSYLFRDFPGPLKDIEILWYAEKYSHYQTIRITRESGVLRFNIDALANVNGSDPIQRHDIYFWYAINENQDLGDVSNNV